MAKTLLLADDSVTIQRVIELTFTHEDVRVVSVGDGQRALQWMETERPDIVLVDVEVPDVDGYAIATHVKSSPRLQQVPVLLLAGAFEPVDEQKARACGCDGVLVKPFEPKQLVTRVKDLLARADAHAGARPAQDREPSARPAEGMGGATVTMFPSGGVRSMTEPMAMPMARAVHGDFDLPAGEPQPLEPPERPVWGDQPAALPTPLKPVEAAPASAPPRVSLVSAFSALLAAEQSAQPAATPAAQASALSDATVEDAVRRVLTRMTDDLVRRIVVETAERLIREEIDKIKAQD